MGNTLSAWTSLGGAGLIGHPALVVYPGSRVRVFVTGGDGVVVRDVSGVWPVDFSPVAGLVATGSPAAVLSPVSGLTEIVAPGADGNIWTTGETTQGSGTWRDLQNETQVVNTTDLAATDPHRGQPQPALHRQPQCAGRPGRDLASAVPTHRQILWRNHEN